MTATGRLTTRETAVLVAAALRTVETIEVVLTPGNGSRYAIVIARPTTAVVQDSRESGNLTGHLAGDPGVLLVSLPDYGAQMLWIPTTYTHPSYVADKTHLGVADAEVLTGFLTELGQALDRLAVTFEKGGV